MINSENGLLVLPRDVDSLVQAMLVFIKNPKLLKTMSERSRQIAEEKFDVEKINAFMLCEMGVARPAKS